MAQVAKVILQDRRVYPWDAWLDGQVWRLEKGVDYNDRNSFQALGARAAGKRGLKLKTQTIDGALHIQAVEV